MKSLILNGLLVFAFAQTLFFVWMSMSDVSLYRPQELDSSSRRERSLRFQTSLPTASSSDKPAATSQLAVSSEAAAAPAANYSGKCTCLCSNASELSNPDNSPTAEVATAVQDSPKRFSTFLLILIPVRPSGIVLRDLIRDTWYKGFTNEREVMMRFAVGHLNLTGDEQFQISEENSTHRDLIYIESEEGSKWLTNKTLALMQWAHENVNYVYFFKCDDDTFVFVNDTLADLRQRKVHSRLYYGLILTDGKVITGDKKWADNSWNLGKRYIPFAVGGGYIISADLIEILIRNTPYLQWHINEDTSVGSWLATFDHERKVNKKFCMFMYSRSTTKRCDRYHPVAYLFWGVDNAFLKKQFYHLDGLMRLHQPLRVIRLPRKRKT